MMNITVAFDVHQFAAGDCTPILQNINIIKMKTRFILTCITVLLLATLSGCKPYYIATDFSSRTAQHKVVAVLPFEMVFTGTKPEKLSEADIREIEEAESKAFMISYYNKVLASTRSG